MYMVGFIHQEDYNPWMEVSGVKCADHVVGQHKSWIAYNKPSEINLSNKIHKLRFSFYKNPVVWSGLVQFEKFWAAKGILCCLLFIFNNINLIKSFHVEWADVMTLLSTVSREARILNVFLSSLSNTKVLSALWNNLFHITVFSHLQTLSCSNKSLTWIWNFLSSLHSHVVKQEQKDWYKQYPSAFFVLKLNFVKFLRNYVTFQVFIVVKIWTVEWDSKRNFHIHFWTLRLFTTVDVFLSAISHSYYGNG